MFGQHGSDVVFDYTLTFKVFKGVYAGSSEVFYDELKMVSSINVKADDDIVFVNLLKNQLMIDQKYGQKQ